ATDGNLHFGSGEASFITTQPLITAPVLPQFARPGDRLLAGLSVTNTSDQSGRLTIDSTVSNGLRFEPGKGTDDNGVSKQFKTRASDSTQAYRFPIQVAGDIGDEREAKLQFQTQLGNEQDAFELPLAIVPLDITEQVVDAGTTENSIDIPLNVGQDVAPNAGGLDVLLSSTVLTDIQAPVKQLERSEDWPNLSTAASRLAIAAHLQTLSQQYGSVLEDFDAQATAKTALDRLQSLQQPDGGFSSWPGFDNSDPFVTPYAATALGAAKKAGLSVDGTLVSQVQTYLAQLLANPGQTDWCNDSTACKNQIRLESLTALSALGSDRQDFLGDLYEQRASLDNLGQIQLARQLSRFDNWKPEADSLANELQATVYETARSATVNLPDAWGWFHSPVASQAQVLELAIARNDSPTTLKRLTDGLLNLRRDGTWQTPYDNAQALAALVAYANQAPEPPNFTASIQLNGKQLANQAFQGYQQPSLELAIPMADLPQGESKLTLNKSPGPGLLHYLTAYRYRPSGNLPGRLQGLRITRSIRPANGKDGEALLYQQGLKASEERLELKAGEVFDIGLEMITDHPVNHVVITDPLPAGLEAVDTSFQTSYPAALEAQQDSWEIGYQELGRDRILAYADQLDAGVYELHYLARSVTPGTFLWPGAEVQLEHGPEEFGRAAAAVLAVQE
ncbi:MAG: alpha-2-macroglobulin family protein, partial [Synechococcales cyanobacterium RM1_1_8]|nr:alpha-2-macroglobulin family protein [Synechococcales cyanobacterium RM1_1_8]